MKLVKTINDKEYIDIKYVDHIGHNGTAYFADCSGERYLIPEESYNEILKYGTSN